MLDAEAKVDGADEPGDGGDQALEVADDERRAHLQDRKLGVSLLLHVAGVQQAAGLEGPTLLPPVVLLAAGGGVLVGGLAVFIMGGG